MTGTPSSHVRGRRTRAAGTPALALALALAAVGAVTASAPAASARSQDRAPTCRGLGVDPKAEIRYRSDIVIKAPISRIFKTQTDVARWPAWQSPVLTAERLDHGPLRAGSAFRWTTPAPATPTTPATTLVITSTVRQLERDRCVRWRGPAVGEGLRIDEGVHVWTFTKVRGGVLVRTEETWTGAQVEADVPTATQALGAGLEAWLRDLKTAAEAPHRGHAAR
ncbi:SRPBCC family protein [Streptomyces griseoviridis]